MIGVNSNIMSMISRHALGRAQDAMSQATHHLATGKKLNRAADDPSGLIAAQNLDAQRIGVERTIEGHRREIHRLSTIDGHRAVLGEMLIELESLVVRASNAAGVSDAERDALQTEADGILKGIGFLTRTARFNGDLLFAPGGAHAMGEGRYQDVDENGERTIHTYALDDIGSLGGLNLLTGDLERAQDVVDRAIKSNATARGAAGARVNALESSIRALGTEHVNVSAALSEIVDADYAEEVANLVRAQVLEQAAIQTTLAAHEQATLALTLLESIR